MTNPDEVVVICVPEDWAHIPEATLHGCDECGRRIWVAPSTWALMKRYPDIIFLCFFCGERQVEKHADQNDEIEFKVAPGADEEFKREMRRHGIEEG